MIAEWPVNPHHGADDMPLGDRIHTLRAEPKWSQAELASRIDADAESPRSADTNAPR